jgi:DNA-binding SARP family transcriptional activator
MLSVSLLGRFNIRYDGKLVKDVDTARMQSLLAYLMLNRDSPQSRAHLAFLFWPDTTEAQARTNLRNLLHTIRHALPDADSYLESSVKTLQWRSDTPFTLDVADFDAALAIAEQATKKGDSTAVKAALEQAVSIYQGDLLPSCYDDWIIPQREGLRIAFLNAMERLVRILEEQRDYQTALRYAQDLLRYDPVQEASYRCLIRLHTLNDDRASALRVYHTCTTILRRELDVEPSSATREVYEQLLGAASKPSHKVLSTTTTSQLVGREKEWLQLLQSWRKVISTEQPHIVLLSGEAGIGKTRLAEELVQWAARQGITCANTRCYAAEGALAFAPVTAWLRAQPLIPMDDIWLAELVRLLPEVLIQRPDLPRPIALTETWQRQHFFEALARAILGISQPLLLTIDDLQWCDQDTMEWLHYLLRFNHETKLLVIGTYRPDEIEENHPLVSFLQALRLEGQVTEMDLQPLDETATQTLGTLVASMELSKETALQLYQETEGNPLFVVETMRAGLFVNDQMPKLEPSKESYQDQVGLPQRVRSVLDRRLAQLSPSTRQLAELAATIGREFSFKLLAKTSGTDEDDLVRQLDELWQRRIIREHGIDGYDFSHDKLREVAYHNMSVARRKLLHHHVAQALEVLHSTDLDPVSHQLAAHYEYAGLPEQAIPYYLRAARVARQVYANEEAINLLQHGLEITKDLELSPSENERVNEVTTLIWEELGDIHHPRAEHEQALQAYHNAQVRVPQEDRIWQSCLHRKIGMVMQDMGLNEEGLVACDRAEAALGDPPDTDDNIWWREWIEVQIDRIWAHYWLYQWPEIEALMIKVKPVVYEKGGLSNRSRLLTASCLMHLLKERFRVSDEVLADAYEAFAISQEWGDLKNKVDTQFELGFLHLWRREFMEAEKNLVIALDMAKTFGIVQMQTLSLTYLTILYRFQGQVDAVMKYALLAQESAKSTHLDSYLAAAWGNQAWLAWRTGDISTAEKFGQEALNMWVKYEIQWLALWPLIGVAIARKQDEQVWFYIQRLLDPHQQLLPESLNTALVAAVQAHETGQADVASQHLALAIDFAREMGYL